MRRHSIRSRGRMHTIRNAALFIVNEALKPMPRGNGLGQSDGQSRKVRDSHGRARFIKYRAFL